MHLSPTSEGGTVVLLKNSTGAPLAKGFVVKADILNDSSVVMVAPGDYDPVGVIYAEILPGAWGRVVTGGIVDIFLDNVGPVDREQWVGVSTLIAGQGTASAIPAPPNSDSHFREIGHTIGTKGAGPGLCRCILHFN